MGREWRCISKKRTIFPKIFEETTHVLKEEKKSSG